MARNGSAGKISGGMPSPAAGTKFAKSPELRNRQEFCRDLLFQNSPNWQSLARCFLCTYQQKRDRSDRSLPGVKVLEEHPGLWELSHFAVATGNQANKQSEVNVFGDEVNASVREQELSTTRMEGEWLAGSLNSEGSVGISF